MLHHIRGALELTLEQMANHLNSQVPKAVIYPGHVSQCSPGQVRAALACMRSSSQNLFVYILEHPSREEALKNWAAFQADPEWQKVKAESEVNGPLVDHIDRYSMDPTTFSAIK